MTQYEESCGPEEDDQNGFMYKEKNALNAVMYKEYYLIRYFHISTMILRL